jgi:PAS domain-containing protein
MKKLYKTNKLYLLIAILTFITIIVSLLSTHFIYIESLKTTEQSLIDIVKLEKGFITTLSEKSLTKDTIIKILDEKTKIQSLGHSGEFVIGQIKHNHQMQLFYTKSYTNHSTKIIPIDAKIATPMKLALTSQSSGAIKGIDYNGKKVIAAYDFIDNLGWGIVAKVDLAELNAPFIKAILIAICIAITLIILGSYLFIRITNPLLKKIVQDESNLKSIFENSADGNIIFDFKGNIIEANSSICKLLNYS